MTLDEARKEAPDLELMVMEQINEIHRALTEHNSSFIIVLESPVLTKDANGNFAKKILGTIAFNQETILHLQNGLMHFTKDDPLVLVRRRTLEQLLENRQKENDQEGESWKNNG